MRKPKYLALSIVLGCFVKSSWNTIKSFKKKNIVKGEIQRGLEKSRIRETPTLSTDADSRKDTNLKRLRDLS